MTLLLVKYLQMHEPDMRQDVLMDIAIQACPVPPKPEVFQSIVKVVVLHARRDFRIWE